MTAVARYLLAEYLRSHRFAPPLLLLAGGVVVLYSQPPNPVLATAGTVAAFVFLAAIWLGLSLLNTQGDADRHVFSVAAGPRAYALGRLLAVAVLITTVSLAVIVLPLLAGCFATTPTPADLAVCLAGTLVCGFGGCALGALFSRPLVRDRAVAALGLTASAVLAVPLGASPAIATAKALDVRHSGVAAANLLPTLVPISLFVVAAAMVCVHHWRRRE